MLKQLITLNSTSSQHSESQPFSPFPPPVLERERRSLKVAVVPFPPLVVPGVCIDTGLAAFLSLHFPPRSRARWAADGGSPQPECTCPSCVHLTACRAPDAGNQEDWELAVSVVEQSTLKATCDTCQNVSKGRRRKKTTTNQPAAIDVLCISAFWLFSGRISAERVGSYLAVTGNLVVFLEENGSRHDGLGYPEGQN